VKGEVMASSTDPIIAHVHFVDGVRRPVFESIDGRQYVLGDDGEPVYGTWFVPSDGDIDWPAIVDGL
jgi:hypothetical protein